MVSTIFFSISILSLTLIPSVSVYILHKFRLFATIAHASKLRVAVAYSWNNRASSTEKTVCMSMHLSICTLRGAGGGCYAADGDICVWDILSVDNPSVTTLHLLLARFSVFFLPPLFVCTRFVFHSLLHIHDFDTRFALYSFAREKFHSACQQCTTHIFIFPTEALVCTGFS